MSVPYIYEARLCTSYCQQRTWHICAHPKLPNLPVNMTMTSDYVYLIAIITIDTSGFPITIIKRIDVYLHGSAGLGSEKI